MKTLSEHDSNLQSDFDLLLLVETKKLTPFSVDGFLGHFSPARKFSVTGHPSGGIALFSNTRLKCSSKIIISTAETLCVSFPSLHLAVIVAYFRPQSDIEVINEKIGSCLDVIPNSAKVILSGDFNCRLDGSHSRGYDLVDLLQPYDLALLNQPDRHTYFCHNGRSTIDLVFVQHSLLHNTHMIIVEHPLTQHCQLQLDVPITTLSCGTRGEKITRFDPDLLQSHLEAFPDNGDPQSQNSRLVDAIKQSAILPRKRKSKPWFDSELYVIHRNFISLRRSNHPDTHLAKQNYKRICRYKLSEYRRYREEQIIKTAESDKGSFWKIIKSRPASPKINGISISEWQQHFQGVLYKGRDAVIPFDEEPLDDYDDPFSILELQSVISKLPGKRAPGKDGITYDAIKLADGTLQSRLLTLFNNIFVTADMPDEWRVSLLMPLYKGKGPLMSPDSYRGIALIPVLQKIYTALIYDRLTDWEEQKKILPDCQYGFRRNRSTLDATRELKSHIQSGMSTVSRYYCVYVDFWKAFDSIDRRKLTKKLYDLFVPTRILDAITSILSDTRVQICQSNFLSDEILTDSGVPQGDKLSPLLFSLYIADLAPVLTKTGCDVVFYADDTVIGSTVIDRVQNALDVLSVYCTENDLEVNVDKTKYMKFRNGGSLGSCERLTYNNTPLEYVSNFTYLGIVLSTTFTITGHLSHLKKKSMKAINSLRNKVNLQKTGFQTAYRLLDAVIKPVATYGVTVFDGLDDAILTQDHCRRVIGLYWKRWARISKFWANTDLIHHLYDDDFLHLQSANEPNRRPIALFYINGLHHLLCIRYDCYGPPDPLDCACRLCEEPFVEKFHLLSCPALPNIPLVSRVLRIYHENSDNLACFS